MGGNNLPPLFSIRLSNALDTLEGYDPLVDWIDSKVLTQTLTGTNYSYENVKNNWDSNANHTWAYILNGKPFAKMYCEYKNHWGKWDDYYADCKSALKTWYSSYAFIYTNAPSATVIYLNNVAVIDSNGDISKLTVNGISYNSCYEYYETGWFDDWGDFLQWETHATLNVRITSATSATMLNTWRAHYNETKALISELELKLEVCEHQHAHETSIADWITNVKNNKTFYENIIARADISTTELNQTLTEDNQSIMSAYYPSKWEKLISLANNKITDNIINYKSKLPSKYADSEIT